MRGMAQLYLQQFKTTFATMVQYRASLFIWMIGHVLEPLVYLVVWSVVAESGGGSAGGYTAAQFAGYFIVLMLVENVSYTWIMYEYDYRIREGLLSSALLRPVHPIHADIADNISSKAITMPFMIGVALVLTLIFHPELSPQPWALAGGHSRAGALLPAPFPAGVDPGAGCLLDHPRQRHQSELLRPDPLPVGADRAAEPVPARIPDRRQHPAVPLDARLSGGVDPGPAHANRGADRTRGTGAVDRPGIRADAHRLAGGHPPVLGGGRMRYLRIFGLYFRVGAMGEMQYRFNFFVHLFQSILQLGMALGGLAVIFTYTNTLGGWLPDEVLALVGVYTLVGGLIGLVVYPSMEQFIMSVRDGMLDFMLVKPVDAQLLNSLQSVDIWRLIDIGLGLGVLITALIRLGAQVGAAQVGLFLGMLLTGSAIIYSFWTMLATLSFWFVRVENILEIFRSMYEAGRWPVSLYPPWLRFVLSFIVPVAFVTTVPVEALTGRLSPATFVIAALLAVVLLVVSRLIWKIGLRQYSGASA